MPENEKLHIGVFISTKDCKEAKAVSVIDTITDDSPMEFA